MNNNNTNNNKSNNNNNNSNNGSSRNTPKSSAGKSAVGPAAHRSVLVRIDNLPPGKSWKEVRYLIGGIVHHSNVVQVKMLPLMSSMVPPFVPFQSCIVTLKSQVDPESLNELLVNLNTYQWHYYNLYAYVLPPLDATPQFLAMPEQPSALLPSRDESSISPSSSDDHMESQTPDDTPMTPSLLYPTPVPGPAPTPAGPAGPPGSATPINAAAAAAAAAATAAATATPCPPAAPTAMMSLSPGLGPGPTSPLGALNGGMPAVAPHLPFMGMGPGPPRRQYYQPNMYGSRKFGGAAGGLPYASGHSSGRNSHRNSRGSSSSNSGNGNGNENDGPSNHKPSAADRYMLSAAAAAAAATAATSTANQKFGASLNNSSRGNITNNNSKRLKQIFNERTFRKQMTSRKMLQLQISGFPPFLKLDSWEPLQAENYRSLGEQGVQLVETDQPEKYGRLRWTTLKDYIKLKCPRLLSLQGEDSSENNTREFYVGVYEDHEEPVGVKIESDDQEFPEYGLTSATIYRAIVGFNSSALYDSCLDTLRDQEYSRGYKLEIKDLPPYEEEQQQQQR